MSSQLPEERTLMLQMSYHLDADIAFYDLAIARLNRTRDDQPPPPKKVKAKPKARSLWVKPWLLLRPMMGQYHLLMNELRLKDVQAFQNFTRMTPHMFFNLLETLTPQIEKQDTNYRKAIGPGTRLALTLRYFASGDSYKSLSYNWLCGANTISKIVKDVSMAINAEYGADLLTPPVIPELWKSNGSASDAQIWNGCELLEVIESKDIGFPQASPVVEGERLIPYFIIGDDAFALKPYLMKPYSKRGLTKEEKVFNYRLSRARRIVENAFGILANRFGCFQTCMRQQPETVTDIILACCCLHNLIRKENPRNVAGVDEEDDDHNEIPRTWRETLQLDDGGLNRHFRNQGTAYTKGIRDYMKTYYSSPEGGSRMARQND
jgi:hypothetical protein